MMKVGVIIPDRGDRPLFTNHCKYLIEQQTLQPEEVMFVNYKPRSNDFDITERYKKGYDYFSSKDIDVIALMENDDWYSPDYLKTMTDSWNKNGRKKIWGTDHNIYYHINIFKYFTLLHPYRSNAMSTLVTPGLEFSWPHTNDPFTDLHLWDKLSNKGFGCIFKPEKTICLGIKHGIGKCGAPSHVDNLTRYTHTDKEKLFLKSVVDQKSFDFYSNYFKDGSIS